MLHTAGKVQMQVYRSIPVTGLGKKWLLVRVQDIPVHLVKLPLQLPKSVMRK